MGLPNGQKAQPLTSEYEKAKTNYCEKNIQLLVVFLNQHHAVLNIMLLKKYENFYL